MGTDRHRSRLVPTVRPAPISAAWSTDNIFVDSSTNTSAGAHLLLALPGSFATRAKALAPLVNLLLDLRGNPGVHAQRSLCSPRRTVLSAGVEGLQSQGYRDCVLEIVLYCRLLRRCTVRTLTGPMNRDPMRRFPLRRWGSQHASLMGQNIMRIFSSRRQRTKVRK